MSIALLNAAWATGAPPTETLVLVALADWANDEGECWPSLAKITGKTRLSVRGVRSAIRRLEAAGHVTSREVSGKGVRYFVHPVADPGRKCPPAGRAGDPGTCCPQYTKNHQYI